MIVTSGPVLIADATDENVKVSQRGWAGLKRDFGAPNLRGILLADVVSFDSLHEYMKARIVKVVEAMRESLKANIHIYDPEWLLANRGEPKKVQPFTVWLNNTRESRRSKEARKN